MKIKILVSFLVFFACQNSFSQFTDIINSNRPGNSMSAFAVGKTVIQLESGFSYIKEEHSLLDYKAKGFGADLHVRYGLFREQLEAILELNYQNDVYTKYDVDTKRSGLKNSTIGAKYLIYDPFKNYEETVNIYSYKANHKFKFHQLIPAVSVYGGANLNFSNSAFTPKNPVIGIVSPKLMLITQNIFPGAFVLVTNIYMDKIGTDYNTKAFIITLTKGFNDQWSGFIENKTLKGTYYSDSIFTLGTAYLFNSDFQMDVSISENYKNTPSYLYGGFGLSWRSASNYKDVLIRSKKEDKKKDKSTKGKDKEKAKKRLDQIELTKP
ncbi:MAG: transporter [Flavobacterium sp.]|nr:transporter [Flavobacterium sp.]